LARAEENVPSIDIEVELAFDLAVRKLHPLYFLASHVSMLVLRQVIFYSVLEKGKTLSINATQRRLSG